LVRTGTHELIIHPTSARAQGVHIQNPKIDLNNEYLEKLINYS
jgi:hypothetical protein